MPEVKRILVTGMTELYGGIESFIMNYFRKMDPAQVQFDFLCYTPNIVYRQEILELGGRIYVIPGRKKDPLRFYYELGRFFRRHGGEYSALWYNRCTLSNVTVLKYARRAGIPVRITHAHNSQNLDGRIATVLHWFNRRSVADYATDFWACSNEAGAWFYPPDIMHGPRYRVIPNAIDAKQYIYNPAEHDRIRRELGLEKKLVVGNVGRFHLQKNHAFLIRVFARLHKVQPASVLLLVGYGPLEDVIHQQIADAGLSDSVILLSHRDDVPTLLQGMDVFVMPSLFEGLPVTLVEAQAAGLPVLASDRITREIAITDSVRFLSLEQSPAEWAEQALEQAALPRRNTLSKIAAAGYDINMAAKKLETFWLSTPSLCLSKGGSYL